MISLLQTVISPELRTYTSPPQECKMVMVYNHQTKRTHIRQGVVNGEVTMNHI